jgi:hypothetical protein
MSYLDNEDTSASLESHYIHQPPEGRVFVNPIDRIFMPTASPFFTKDLEIYRQPGNVLLQPGTQYKALWMHRDASRHAGKEVCAVIYIIDTTVNEITMKYRTIGGDWVNDINDVVGVLSLPNANEVTWGQIVGVPAQFEPVEHLHHVRNLFGMEELLTMGESLRRALVNDADTPVIAAIYQYIDAKLQSYAKFSDVTDIGDDINIAIGIHKGETNAHTKDKVGLSDVANLPLATDGVAYTGTSNAHYTTPSTAIKSMLGALRTVGSSVTFDPNNLTIAPIQLCRHNNCPTEAAGNSAGDRFMIFTGVRVANSVNVNTAAEYATQVAFAIDTGAPSPTPKAGIYTRFYPIAPGTWSPWLRLDVPNSTSLGNVDLDSILTSGTYHQTTPGNATQPNNYPSRCRNEISILTVSAVGSGRVVQEIRNVNPTFNYTTEYVRYYDGASWSTWRSPYDDTFSFATNLSVDPNTTLRTVVRGGGVNFPTNDAAKYIIWTIFEPVTHGDAIVTATKRHQIAFVSDVDGKEGQGIFQRYFDGAAWKPWTRVRATNAIDTAAKRYDVNTTPNSPNVILDSFFRFNVVADGEGGLGLPLGSWYIQNFFDTPSLAQTTLSYRTQFAFLQADHSEDRRRQYVRRCGTDGNWTRWMKSDIMGYEFIPKTVDLDTVVLDGTYVQYNGAMTAEEFEAANYPAAEQGILTVRRLWNGSTMTNSIHQTYESHYTFGVWKRRSVSGALWSDWFKVQDERLDNYKDHPVAQAMKRMAALNPLPVSAFNLASHTTMTLGAAFNSNDGTYHTNLSAPLLAADGCVYAVRTNWNWDALKELHYQVYDPINDRIDAMTVTLPSGEPIGTSGGMHRFSLVVPGIGSRIYFIPDVVGILGATGSASIIFNDVFTDDSVPAAKFGVTYLPLTSGWYGWRSGCMSLNGDVYCPPSTGNKVLKIAADGSPSLISGVTGVEPTLYVGAQLALDGKIYCAPGDATKILIIDPATDQVEEKDFGLNLAGAAKYAGILLGADGRLYCIPNNATDILIIDTANQTAYFHSGGSRATSPANTFPGANKWYGGCMGPDGKLWCSMVDATLPLIIDTMNGSAALQGGTMIASTPMGIGALPSGGNKFSGFALTTTGQLYAPAVFSATHLFYTQRRPTAVPLDLLYSPYLNKAI